MSNYWKEAVISDEFKSNVNYQLDKLKFASELIDDPNLPSMQNRILDGSVPLKVDDLFTGPCKAIVHRASPTFKTPQDFISAFDRPDELTYEMMGTDTAFVYKKAEKELVNRRREIGETIMREMGVFNKGVANLSIGEIAEIRKKIKERIANETQNIEPPKQ